MDKILATRDRVLLTDFEAADYLGRSVQTVRNWRWLNKYGPPYLRFPNGRIMYELAALDSYIDAARVDPEATDDDQAAGGNGK